MKQTAKTSSPFETLAQTLRKWHLMSRIQWLLVHLAMLLTVGVVVVIVCYILITGIPNLKLELFAWTSTTVNKSMMPALVNTLCMTVLSLLMAVPVGVGGAIYLTEYAHRGSKLVKLVSLTSETLAGIPSIVYGLFGFMFFNIALGWGYSMLAGSVTLAIMILPLILRNTQEALLSVPDSYREGAFGLGAGKLRTVVRIILPSAMPGILAGIILGIGRIVGESAALLFTSGTGKDNLMMGQTGNFFQDLTAPLFQSTRTMSVHMYVLMNEGIKDNMQAAQATAVVLLVMVVGINAASSYLAKKLTKGKVNG